MAGKSENFSELNRKHMEAAMRLAQLSIENSQRVMALQSDLARELFQQSVENARQQSTAKDPQEVLRLRTTYAQETAQKMMETAQKVAQLGNDARVEFSRMLTEQLASGSQDMADAFQGFFHTLPGQNANMLDMMQQAMATANSAFEQIAQASTAAFSGMTDAAAKTTGGTSRKK
jgi:phasin family protein